MPELPEVEISRRNLARWAVGSRVAAVEAIRPASFRDGTRARALDLEGAIITEVLRYGKVMFIGSDGAVGWIVRFGMSGKWVRVKENTPPKFARALLHMEDGQQLAFVDLRNFGGIWGVASRDGKAQLRALVKGRDPIINGLDGPQLEALLAGRKTPIKSLLLNQTLVAGVGNIYASEALFVAGIHPLTPAGVLTEGDSARLAEGIRERLGWAIEHEDGEEIAYLGEAGMKNAFLVYQRAGEACPRCAGEIQKIIQAQRSTFFCARCQPWKVDTARCGYPPRAAIKL